MNTDLLDSVSVTARPRGTAVYELDGVSKRYEAEYEKNSDNAKV